MMPTNEQWWAIICTEFLSMHPEYKSDKAKYLLLDDAVKKLAAKPETKEWCGLRFLETAHKQLTEARMSLSKIESEQVMAQVKNKTCPNCGDELVAHDDGTSTITEWGVSGAYVSCEACGYLHTKEAA